MRTAVFLDRDGTIIEDRGHLADPEEVIFFPATIPALRRLAQEHLLFIVTHQSGIAKGLLDASDVDRVNRHVVASLAGAGVEVAEVYVCPHNREDGCDCVKPKPFFLHQAAQRYGLDLSRSFTIGDHPQDVQLGLNAGGHGIYLLTGHGDRHLAEIQPDWTVVADIGEAARWIVERGIGAGAPERPR